MKSEHRNVNDGKSRVAILLSGFASLGGWFFGYDQGVTGGIVVMSSFKNDFCIGVYANESICDLSVNGLPSGYRQFLIFFTLFYNIGCFLGAFVISSFIAERFGRRAIIFTSSVLFIIGTSMVIFPPGGSKKLMILILIGRIVEGTGVGCSSYSCPLYASEIAPTHLRGMLSGFMQMTIVLGLFAANLVNYFLQNHKWGWRLSNGIILIAPLIVMLGIFCCPETPRWLYKNKGRQSAEQSLKSIRKVENVDVELDAIADVIRTEERNLSFRQLFTIKKVRQRLGIGVGVHVLSQTTGINPVLVFGGIIFESIIGNGIISLLILSGAIMLSTIPALFLFDRIGRRKLLLICGLGMIIGHLLSATVFLTGCHQQIQTIQNETLIEKETIVCARTSGMLMLIFTVIFVVCFAISWGPISWIYAAEIFPLNVRSRSVSITTGSNWFTGIFLSYILELINPLGIHGVFYLFSAFTFLGVVFVYLFCPETKGVLLEDIENVFDDFQWKNRRIIKFFRKFCHRNIVQTAL